MTDEQILNLELFREITGGEPEIEKELFSEFEKGTNEQFDTLGQIWDKPDKSHEWSSAGHAIKGNAMMLGAEKLASMGKHVQLNPDDDANTKKAYLDDMTAEYERVKDAINKIHE